MADHTESIQIDFDASVVTYDQLLALFWTNHTSTRTSDDRQYMSAIWCQNEEQLRAALGSKAKLAHAARVTTVIEQISSWTNAEDYHQKFYLRSNQSLFAALGIDGEELINSPTATKLNWYSNGNGTAEELDKDIKRWKTSSDKAKAIRKALGGEFTSSAACGR